MANIWNIDSNTVRASASITITDQTDAANLAGGLQVINSSKNQVFLVDQANPYSPDWSRNNLVIKPYVYASTIIKNAGGLDEYNPDIFDPIEYPDLTNPGDLGLSVPYIKNLNWYYRDVNGIERPIEESAEFSFSYTINTNNGQVQFSDKRYLVIKQNILEKDSSGTVICRFNYNDPFAKIQIKQTYEMDLTCLSTGKGTNQLIIQSVNGTVMTNTVNHVELYAEFYKEGQAIDIQQELENSAKSSTLYWYIRNDDGNGWTLLDGTKQDEEGYEYMDQFEVHRYVSYDNILGRYTTEKTNSDKGGFFLRINEGLILGSNVIKAVFRDSDLNHASFSAIELVTDTSDEIQAYISSSNGDKIYQGMNSQGTDLVCFIKERGILLESFSEKYDLNYDYYWFKISSDGSETWNLYIDEFSGELIMMPMVEGAVPKNTQRLIHIDGSHVDNINMFQCVVVDKIAEQAELKRSTMILNSPTEDDINTAIALNNELGIDESNTAAILETAYEINASNISNNKPSDK